MARNSTRHRPKPEPGQRWHMLSQSFNSAIGKRCGFTVVSLGSPEVSVIFDLNNRPGKVSLKVFLKGLRDIQFGEIPAT